MKKIIVFLVLFIVVVGLIIANNPSNTGLSFLEFMVGLYLLFWALIITVVLRGAVKVTSEMKWTDRQG